MHPGGGFQNDDTNLEGKWPVWRLAFPQGAMLSSNIKYIGLRNVHQEAITAAVRSGAGNQERSQAPWHRGPAYSILGVLLRRRWQRVRAILSESQLNTSSQSRFSSNLVS